MGEKSDDPEDKQGEYPSAPSAAMPAALTATFIAATTGLFRGCSCGGGYFFFGFHDLLHLF